MPAIRDIHKTQRVSCKNCGVSCSSCCNIYFGLASRHAYVTYSLPSNSCAGGEGGFSVDNSVYSIVNFEADCYRNSAHDVKFFMADSVLKTCYVGVSSAFVLG